ncbi:MAG: GlsB/YeaQ/YmgE family stress response membrane protein [Verrucomicrobiota bacterium]
MEMNELMIIAGIGIVIGIVAGFIIKADRFGRIGAASIGAAGGFLGAWLLSISAVDFSLGEVWMDSAASAAIGSSLLLALVGLTKIKLK